MFHLSTTINRLEDHIRATMQRTRTPAVALALFDRNETIHVCLHGVADLASQAPVQRDSLFGIGSITKSFTAVAVMQAVEEGLIDRSAPVTAYLTWFKVRSLYEPITVHHLLSHTAGLVTVIDRSPDPRGAVWALRDTETGFPPGTRFSYSDAGYQMLALMLEHVTGQPFSEIIRRRIFGPLGMSASEPAITHAVRPRAATGYASMYDDRPPYSTHPLVPATWIETNAGDCCILSTADDLARFGRMLLNSGQGDNGRVLSSTSFQRLFDAPVDTGRGFSYGYGLEIHNTADGQILGHAGGIPGYESCLQVDRTNGVGVALLNTEPAIGNRVLANAALRVWRAAYQGKSPADIVLSVPDPTRIENAADYEGVFRSGVKTVTFVAEGERLTIRDKQQLVSLEKRGADRFYANHPDFDRFHLRFARDESNNVVELFYGPEWYVAASHEGPVRLYYPSEWDSYLGHYRSHNSWQTNFRVIRRQGRLWLAWPNGEEDSLTPLEPQRFRIGDEISAERLTFAQFVKDEAFCANLSGTDYYRFFTP